VYLDHPDHGQSAKYIQECVSHALPAEKTADEALDQGGKKDRGDHHKHEDDEVALHGCDNVQKQRTMSVDVLGIFGALT
jgi:hypothetical protein